MVGEGRFREGFHGLVVGCELRVLCWWTARSCGRTSTRRAHSKRGTQAIGHSRGGPTTKIVALTDALGNLARFTLLAGHRHELRAVEPLLAGVEFGALIADKAYDSDALRAEVLGRGAQVVIPPRANRTRGIECDKEMYKWRPLVENFFCNLKHFRRIATHYEKTDTSYQGMIHVVGSCLALA